MENNAATAAHTLNVEQCKKITATAIESVNGFSPRQINLSYSGGKIFIYGDDLKIINFSKSTGAFCALGKIYGVKYGESSEKLFKKIFK